jgi:hypothetical protein
MSRSVDVMNSASIWREAFSAGVRCAQGRTSRMKSNSMSSSTRRFRDSTGSTAQ